MALEIDRMNGVSVRDITLPEAMMSEDTVVSNGLHSSNGVVKQNGSGVNGIENGNIDINEIVDKEHKRTRLMLAAIEGNLELVERLVGAGADLRMIDSSGLNARELATLEGNLVIAMLIKRTEIEYGFGGVDVEETKGYYSPLIRGASSLAQGPLHDKTMILVKPGSGDARKGFRVIKLGPHYSKNTAKFDGMLHIRMSSEDDAEYQTQDVRVEDNCAAQPVVFYATDPANVKLVFDVAHDMEEGLNQRPPGARAVALLANLVESSTTHVSLHGDINVPLISETDRDVVGTMTFNILIVRPFKHEKFAKIAKQTFPPASRANYQAKTMVVGHRGLGKNMQAQDVLQLGENTIDSFNTAARLGAEYVEFDVQVTKDRVPVIYHDFLVGEAGVDVPIHEVTTEQLMYLGNKHIKSPRIQPMKGTDSSAADRPRSMSYSTLENANNDISSNMRSREERMANTYAMKERGFKANTPGRHIVAPFTTLEEMFQKINKDTGFNIEVKYPMLAESEGHGNPSWNSWELNLFVDTILNKVFDLCQFPNGQTRKLYFSSFHADVCLLLKMKQDRFPVMFLTTGEGKDPNRVISDPRASNLSQAVAHCENWALDGVVSEADPLVLSPKLVRYIRDRGMRCLSYGTMNNDVENVKKQVLEGIDAVIVDRVGRVVKAMKEIYAETSNGLHV